MNDNKIKEYVTTQLEYDYKTDVHPTNTQAMVKISHDMIIKTVKEFAQKTTVHILDIGCGWGDFSNKLDPYIEDYIGVEPSIIELERFQKDGKTHNRYLVRGFGEYLDFINDNSRNIILLNSVLDHCYDWKKVIENCKRILAPNGLIIIAMENSNKLPLKVKKILGFDVKHKDHLVYFSEKDLLEIFDNGFKMIKKRTSGFLFGFHTITKYLPVPKSIMIAINKVSDKSFNLFIPNSGHMLFNVFVSDKANNIVNNITCPFNCPSCEKSLNFGIKDCQKCGFSFDYRHSNILDSIQIAKKMDITLPI